MATTSATTSSSKCGKFGIASITLGLTMLLGIGPVGSQVLPNELKRAVVKVTVTDANRKGQSATGFLWETNEQVVTSLHAVVEARNQDRTIRVYCNNVPTQAKVRKVLQRADLVLLSTDKPIDKCTVFNDKSDSKPEPRTPLFTFGWKGGATSATNRDLIKGDVYGAETLSGLVDNPNTKTAIKTLNFPALDLGVYFVQGPLSGGYSGGPVVDKAGTLRGIVDGGLDKGQSSYNWLIPAENLSGLIAAEPSSALPDVDLELLRAHFSAGIVEPDEVQTEVSFTPQPKLAEPGSTYQFVKTKTRTLAELADTSDDPEGIRRLVQAYGSAVGKDVENLLVFDVFEDIERGLIIAVPADQGLIDAPFEDNPDVHSLRSEAPTEGDGFIQFEELVPDAEGWQQVATDANGDNYYPGEAGYFDAYVFQALSDCRDFNDACSLDEATLRKVKFEDGNKVLNFGFHVKPLGEDVISYYSYESVAVEDNKAFRTSVQIHIADWEEGLFQCVDAAPACADPRLALTHLSQLVAAELTTFAERRVE